MRLGSTSYVHPADILTNVRRIGKEIPEVRDIELIIFEAEEAGYPLPSEKLRTELRRLASRHGFSYTVHLPLDLRIASADNGGSIAEAVRVIRSTEGLIPTGYVIHVEGGADAGVPGPAGRLSSACKALERIGREAGALESLCVENTAVADHHLLDEIVARLPVSRCVDVGHLWKARLDPVPFLDKWLERAGIVHLHGVGERDHLSLALMPFDRLTPVVSRLSDGFSGVVTLEVFSEADLRSSLSAITRATDAGAKKPAD
jgi:sugar phosphate isomerase/epimerase